MIANDNLVRCVQLDACGLNAPFAVGRCDGMLAAFLAVGTGWKPVLHFAAARFADFPAPMIVNTCPASPHDFRF